MAMPAAVARLFQKQLISPLVIFQLFSAALWVMDTFWHLGQSRSLALGDVASGASSPLGQKVLGVGSAVPGSLAILCVLVSFS